MATATDNALVPQMVYESDSSRLMPALALDQMKQRYNAILEFAKSIMKDGKDYGAVPGTDKPTLLKPGAEKLTSFFGLSIEHPEILEKVEDWTGREHGGIPFFYYMIRQDLTRNGVLIASQIGSCNSMETKYRWRWVREGDLPHGLDKASLVTRDTTISEFAFAIDKAETTGKYGKPAEYWAKFKEAITSGRAKREERQTRSGMSPVWTIAGTLYRVPNEAIFDQVNTIQKMAEKRALVAATLLACNASEHFTQDMEDMEFVATESGDRFPSAPSFTTSPPSATPHTVAGGATMDDLAPQSNGTSKPPAQDQVDQSTPEATNTEQRNSVEADAIANQYAEQIASLEGLPAVEHFKTAIVPTIAESARPLVLLFVAQRELMLQNSIVECTKIAQRFPQLSEMADERKKAIRASRGQGTNGGQ